MRLAPAAKQLIADVTATDKGVTAEPHGDPDGLGVTRSVAFDNAPWLADALEAVDDHRITNVRTREDRVFVDFVTNVEADYADPFPVREAHAVLTASSTDEPEPPKKRARKAPAKKATPAKD